MEKHARWLLSNCQWPRVRFGPKSTSINCFAFHCRKIDSNEIGISDFVLTYRGSHTSLVGFNRSTVDLYHPASLYFLSFPINEICFSIHHTCLYPGYHYYAVGCDNASCSYLSCLIKYLLQASSKSFCLRFKRVLSWWINQKLAMQCIVKIRACETYFCYDSFNWLTMPALSISFIAFWILDFRNYLSALTVAFVAFSGLKPALIKLVLVWVNQTHNLVSIDMF